PVTAPLTTCWSVLQLTVTDVTWAPPTEPVAPDSMQVWAGLLGCVAIVTANALPLSCCVGKVKGPDAVTGKSAPSFRRISPEPVSPTTTPPTLYLFVVQVTAMSLTAAVETSPLALAIVQVWAGDDGLVRTVTA